MIALREKHFQKELSFFNDLGRFGFHPHPFSNRKGAGRLKPPLPLNFNQTDPASPKRGNGRMMTQTGNINTGCLGRLHDGLSGPGPNVTSIYFYIHHFIH